uniref:Uncharacterized protein n=1 Tax=Rhizophora mucronata TaxID=61149 RepID=A0A2P2PGA3_RHIMU
MTNVYFSCFFHLCFFRCFLSYGDVVLGCSTFFVNTLDEQVLIINYQL